MWIWPVFVWRTMYEDTPHPLRLGDEVAWNMVLVDGEAAQWPSEVLIDTTVRIDEPPVGAPRGLVARTPELSACWGGRSPVGSEFHIRAGLAVDWFNPPFRATVTGTIRRMAVISSSVDSDAPSSPPEGPWRLHEIKQVPDGLRGAIRCGEGWLGLLVGLAVRAHHLEAF